MLDNFALVLIHGLLAIAGWRLLMRDELDDEQAQPASNRADAGPEAAGHEAAGRND
ncbi:MAG: hypothetical protein WCY11_03110 [Novosphingobium sp.]